jgi:hypothetical protein
MTILVSSQRAVKKTAFSVEPMETFSVFGFPRRRQVQRRENDTQEYRYGGSVATSAASTIAHR